MVHAKSTITAAQVAERLGIAVTWAQGEAERSFAGLTTLERASLDSISFVTDRKFLAQAKACHAGMILLPQSMVWSDTDSAGAPFQRPGPPPLLLHVPSVWAAILSLLRFFHPERLATGGIHPTAVVENGARIAPDAEVGPQAFVAAEAEVHSGAIVGAGAFVGEGAIIGEGTRILPRAIVMHGCQIGCRCRIGPGAVIGYDGFKTERLGGHHVSIPQVGIVVLEDDVEIGAGSCIDRASFHETRIGARTKIDNLVQIGHNVTIGPDCLICSQAGIAGSTTVGAWCMMGGQVGVADHVKIESGTILMAQSGVPSALGPGVFFGSPAMPARQAQRVQALLPRLPEMHKAYRQLFASQPGESTNGDDEAVLLPPKP